MMKFATPLVGAAAVLAMAVTLSWAQSQPGGPAAGDFGGPPLTKDDVEQKILMTFEEMRCRPRYANVSPIPGC